MKPTISYFDPFELKWQFATSENATQWVDMGTSKNRLYVTHGKPRGGLGLGGILISETRPLNTTLYKSCENAKGLSDPDAIAAAIYAKFQTRGVRKIDSEEVLTYWGNWADGQSTCASAFLTDININGNATCGTWAFFFNDMLKMQGLESRCKEVSWANPIIDEYKVNEATAQQIKNYCNDRFGSVQGYQGAYVSSTSSIYEYRGAFLFVKKWLFDNIYTDPITPTDERLYLNTPPDATEQPYVIPNQPFTESDIEGIPAQGTLNPRSAFLGHALVVYNNQYYDPSYGTPVKSSLESWEAASIAGYGTFVTLGFNGTGANYIYIIEYNSSNIQLTETP